MKRSLALAFAFFATLSVLVLQPKAEIAEASGGFTALAQPVRFLDTRPEDSKVGGYEAGRQPRTVVVTGRDGVPSGATAVAMNLTVTATEANDFGGYATVYPCGGTVPTASNLNFVTGDTIANSVIAPVSSVGTVCVDVYGKAHLLIDISGYFTAGFESLAQPVRFLDTRPSGDKVGGYDTRSPYTLTVTGLNGIPAGAAAVAMNLTVTSTEANSFGGYATVYPCGGTVPTASNLNFVNGQTIANSVIAPVSSAGTICIDVYGRAHVLVDISGYFSSGFSSLSQPVRFLDTRQSGTQIGRPDLMSTGEYVLGVTGRDGVPAGVTAVAMNLTVTSAEANDFGGYATVYPCSQLPTASNLNFVTGQTVANSVIAPVSSAGQICIAVYGYAHVLVDISGYLSAESTSSGGGGSGSGGVATTALTFDLAGAAGVALVDEPVTRTTYRRDGRGKVHALESSSNLLAVDENGGTRAATASGMADISRLLVAPNNKVYVLFQNRVNLDDTSLQCTQRWESNGPTGEWFAYREVPVTSEWGTYTEYREVDCEPPCLLGEINPATGTVECIDNELQSIWWNDWNATSSPAIQFDDEGGVYYHGYTDEGRTLLRRYSAGRTTDLVNDNISIQDFLVTGDGRIYTTGTTNSTNDQWFRELTPVVGQVRPSTEQILRGYVEWMKEFPDGNIYYSSSSNWSNIDFWDPDTKSSSTWLLDTSSSPSCVSQGGGSVDSDGDGFQESYLNYYSLCDYSVLTAQSPLAIPGCYTEQAVTTQLTNWSTNIVTTVVIPDASSRQTTSDFFCSQPGRLRLSLHRTIQGAVYGIAGEQWGSYNTTSVARYYPTPEVFTSDVVRATVALPIMDYMVISGSDANDDYITTLFDLGEGVEIPLIGRNVDGSNEEIEVYRMSVSSGTKVLFDGMRFADSSYVIGSIDLTTGDYVVSETGGQRLLDFQTFS